MNRTAREHRNRPAFPAHHLAASQRREPVGRRPHNNQFSPDGTQLAGMSWWGEVALWGVESWTVIRRIPGVGMAGHTETGVLDFSPDGTALLLFRGRMDERYDTARAVRDREFRYVRNYSPHRPWGQHYSYAFEVQPSMRSWFAG